MADLTYPTDLKYSKNDEWVRIEGDTATIGISDYAQDALNDLVFLEYQVSVGDTLDADDVVAVVESVKADSEIFSPVAGEVIELNKALEDEQDDINSDPYGNGWLVKIKLSGAPDTGALMDSTDYEAYCESRG